MTNTTKTPGFFTDEEVAEHKRAFVNMLVERYEQGLKLHPTEKREARRAIKARKEFAKQRAATEGSAA